MSESNLRSSSSSSKRRHSKVNIVKQNGIDDFLKSLESEIELNRGYLSKSVSKSPHKSHSSNDTSNHILTRQSMVDLPVKSKSPHKSKTSNKTISDTSKRSSLIVHKSLNFENEIPKHTGYSTDDSNNGLSTIKPKKRVSVISPKRTPLTTLSLNTMSSSVNNQNNQINNSSTSSILNSSRLSVKDLKDNSSLSSSSGSSSSSSLEYKKSNHSSSHRRESIEFTKETLEEMVKLHSELKLHIPKEMKRDMSRKSEDFKNHCSKVLSKIDNLLSRVKIINESKNNLSNNSSLTSTPIKSKVRLSSPIKQQHTTPTTSSPKYSKYSPKIR